MDDITGWIELIRTPPDALNGRIDELVVPHCTSLMASTLPELAQNLRPSSCPTARSPTTPHPNCVASAAKSNASSATFEESLRHMLRRLAEGGSTQDELITIRGERFVIPIKAEQKRRVPGVVHGASSSGQTVYVEPLETIEQNNELVRMLEEEQAEIHRIFLAMTRQIGAQANAIGTGARVLAEVESLVIRGRFAEEFQCVRPRFFPSSPKTSCPSWSLTQARHPLLEKRLRNQGHAIVPISLQLTSSERQLIISGPNTGGKTVGLKTTGLLVHPRPGRHSRTCRTGRLPALHQHARRYRRLPVHRTEPLHLLRPHRQP